MGHKKEGEEDDEKSHPEGGIYDDGGLFFIYFIINHPNVHYV